MLDPRIEPSSNHIHSFNPTRNINDSYDGFGAMNFGGQPPKNPTIFENHQHWNGGGVQFRVENTDHEFDVCSPPLWKTSPGKTHENYGLLSPNSRTQAIVRGQWELMEMVKKMPDSCYELSLKDLVEQYPRAESQEECLVGEKILKQRVKVTKRQESMGGGRGIDNRGLFLNMVFPFSFGSGKKKKLSTNIWSRVSPKPEANSEKSSKAVDREWWKKRFSVLGESESGGESRNSSGSSRSSRSSSIRSSSSCSTGCRSFFFFRQNKKGSK
ncbi:hypothetical protein Acr_21g0004830 [Actinidia rufa]|uniref:Uncharacterized protein n=1 Tax=Actinidia rufa TaxID=165716 RepID=A0A7J0GGK3_9ERIC|nr:hypothetical protein Acr_21g0004830 [Actinidia rufa]